MGVQARNRTQAAGHRPDAEAAVLGIGRKYLVLQVPAQDPGEEDQDRGPLPGQV